MLVLSAEVFHRLQAPYREKLEAELARARRRAEADRERSQIELAAKREAGEAENFHSKFDQLRHDGTNGEGSS